MFLVGRGAVRVADLDACVRQSMSEMTLDVFRDFSIWDYDELSLDAGAQLPQQIP